MRISGRCSSGCWPRDAPRSKAASWACRGDYACCSPARRARTGCWPRNCSRTSCRSTLYQIDLARIVSKYTGDTEKNLDALFKAAEASDAVLVFDDTDHLFGAPPAEESGRFPNLDVAQLASASSRTTASWCLCCR
jgi:hypothetical protein